MVKRGIFFKKKIPKLLPKILAKNPKKKRI